MDDYKELNKWILAHAKFLDLQVERLHWVNSWLPEYHDFRVTGKMFGHTFEGRGTDKNEEVAFYKSFSELIERMYCFALNINSNGVAAHIDKSKAIVNAKNELIERDAVLCHHLTETSFIKAENFIFSDEFEVMFLRLNNEGITLTLALAQSAIENDHVAICHADGGAHFGVLCGFGCNENLNSAFESAILECLINVVAYLDGNLDLPQLSANDLYKKDVPRGLDHKRVHFSHKLFKLNTGEIRTNTILKMDKNIFEIEALKGPSPLFDDLPLHVTRATSPHLQDIFYGEVQKKNVNLPRLKAFTGKELSFGVLAMGPHPIG